MLSALAVLAPACDQDGARHGQGSDVSEQRAMLSEGYSLLYADASKIDRVGLVLYVKKESQEFDDVVTEVSKFGDEFRQDLERIARDYPGVRIDLEPLPVMEARKRFAISMDRMLRFAPLVGRSRLEYERTMLIGLAGALDHERHLCRVMAREEPDAGLKKVLVSAEKRYDGLYDLVMNLLNREHFKHNDNAPPASPPGA
jgi:hypothetical protein